MSAEIQHHRSQARRWLTDTVRYAAAGDIPLAQHCYEHGMRHKRQALFLQRCADCGLGEDTGRRAGLDRKAQVSHSGAAG